MTNPYVTSVLAHYLNKRADEHEAAESPNTEMLEHAMGGSEAGGEEHEGAGDAEHLLSQLSPEELEQLAHELSSDMAHPEQQAGGEDVAQLAHAIQGHLDENPEAAAPEGLPPEKAAALNMIKSAAYIEGFIGQALTTGLNTKQAVDMYDQVLTETVEALNKSAGKARTARRAAERAAAAAAKANNALVVGTKPSVGSRASQAYGNFKNQMGERARRFGQYARTRPGRVGLALGGAALAGGATAAALSRNKPEEGKEEEKTAAYLEGIYKRALEYGFNDQEAEQLVYDTLDKVSGVKDFAKKHLAAPAEAVAGAAARLGKKVYKHRGKLSGAAAAAAGGGAGYALGKRNRESSEDSNKD